MSETIGTQESDFPAAIPDLTAISEAYDQPSPSELHVEGWRLNKIAAELLALARELGIERGLVSVDNSTPASPVCDVAPFRSIYSSPTVFVDFAGEAGVALTDGEENSIYLDLDAGPPAIAVSIAGWPGSGNWIPLAVWDDTGTDPVLLDKRPTL